VVYDVLDELVLVEVTVPETTEEDVGPVVDEELDDDVTVPLFVLVELVGLELPVEEDETEDVLLDELLVATEELLELLVDELVDEIEVVAAADELLLDELVLEVLVELVVVELVDEHVVVAAADEELLLVVEVVEVLLVVGEVVLVLLVVELVEELLLVIELVDEVELLLVVEVVEVLLVVDEELLLVVVVEVLLVVGAELLVVVEVVEVLLVEQIPFDAGTDPHWYTSNLFPAPQYSSGAPPQGILQSDNGAETLPHANWFPQ
jgi:hypothetical protein